MNTRKIQRGYTLIELLVVIAFIAIIGLGCGLLYVLVHFLAKFW